MEYHADGDVIELAKSINTAMDIRTKPMTEPQESCLVTLQSRISYRKEQYEL